MMSCRLFVKQEGKKLGKYVWMRLNTSTWPRGVRGMMRMMVKGMKVSRSRAVRRRADTSRGFRVPPAFTPRRETRVKKQRCMRKRASEASECNLR